MITREKLVTQLASITQQEEGHRADLIALRGARSLCEHWLAELDAETAQAILGLHRMYAEVHKE